MLPMRALSMALAGTDFVSTIAFVRAAEEYRRVIQRVMNDDIARHAKPGAAYTAGPDLWSKVPEFRYDPPGPSQVLRGHGIEPALAGPLAGRCDSVRRPIGAARPSSSRMLSDDRAARVARAHVG